MLKKFQPMIIETKNIFKTFVVKSENVKVLNNISITVNKGDFLIIFGPSGCGKSTLLHILLGLESPTSGEVIFLGQSLYNHLDEDDRTDFRKLHIGMVYQQPNWIRSLSVKDNVIFALRLNGCQADEAEKRTIAELEKVGMLKWADYIPTELSSGQQQKVALSRAMVTNPEIIIADEPTGNLDFVSGQELMNLLAEQSKLGKTVIMVTHDLEYLSFANRAIQMLDGRVINEINNPVTYIKENSNLLKRSKK